MQFDHYDHGVPSWVDCSTPDRARSQEFYGRLFEWEFTGGTPEAGNYTVAELGGRQVAGVAPLMDPNQPPAWTTYVNVDSADDVVARASAGGGRVLVGPMDVMEAGRMAVLADPQGAVIGLWQPGLHTGAQLANEPGTYCWSELVTTDVAGATAFYADVFGWEVEAQGPYNEWKVGGRSVAGMTAKPDTMPAEVPPHWGVYFAVADCDVAAEQIAQLGGTVMVPPTDIEPGRFAVAADPVGAMFNVLAMKPGLSH